MAMRGPRSLPVPIAPRPGNTAFTEARAAVDDTWPRVLFFPAYLLKPRTALERALLEVAERGSSSSEIAAALCVAGFRAEERVAPAQGLAGVRHSHVRVTHKKHCYVIDAEFREQFELPFASPAYRRMVGVVPEVVVSRSDCFFRAAEQLARLMASEFEYHGMSLPPWRRPESMLRRWAA